ncbi:hypothetical protein AVEN_83034-1 [Araneus ventricosus]|uniref:Uncharacterized protein n=1 Tax=Araneus ventricosus TaxID=182803 RepID=A0A4Y2IRQ7_ARAVE|nr:hypothetical protein AVEN_83034-1 [Araneus ventricosus]
MTRTTPELENPVQISTPAGGRLAHFMELNMQYAQCMMGLQWHWVSKQEPSGSEAGLLPLGHRGVYVEVTDIHLVYGARNGNGRATMPLYCERFANRYMLYQDLFECF